MTWQLLWLLLAAIAGLLAPPVSRPARRQVGRVWPRRHERRLSRPDVRVPAWGIDWSYGVLTPRQLRRIGVQFVCRYLSDDPVKDLTARECRRLGRAGIRRIVVWETSAERALMGRVAGIADRAAAGAELRALGAASGTAIYFAVDADVSGQEVEQYFRGLNAPLPTDRYGDYQIGVYGGYDVVDYLLQQHLVLYAWQTAAWSDDRWHPGASVLQYSFDHEIDGVSCDFDRVVSFPGWW